MRKDSRDPPSRHSPEAVDKLTDTSQPAVLVPDESSPDAAVPAAHDAAGQPGSADATLSLPRRVRGASGALRAARVEPPVFPEGLLERVRAAAAASEANEEPEAAPRGREERNEHGAQVNRDEAPTASSALPQRAGRRNGSLVPPAQVRAPFLLKSGKKETKASEDLTQPVPGIFAPKVTRSPSSAADDLTIDLGAREIDPRSQDSTSAEAPGKSLIDGEAAASEHPTSGTSVLPATGTAADHRTSAGDILPAQRRVMRQAPRKTGPARTKGRPGGERSSRSYRLASLLAIVVALAVGVGAFAVFRRHGHNDHRPSIPSSDLPLVIRNGAAAWVATQVADRDIVACDPVMCHALRMRGVAASRLRVLWPGSSSLDGCAVVVATPTVQGQLGTRLDAVYGPGIIARFGSGDQQIAVRVIALHGAAAYRSDLGRDLAARKASGAVLVAQAPAQLSATEKKELNAGQVDSRLIVAVAAIENKHKVEVRAFGSSGPGVNMAASPFRSADLVVTNKVSVRAMVADLAAAARQDERYHPAKASTVQLGDHQTVLRIEYAAPSPLGLFGY
jgi:hypothetical protein